MTELVVATPVFLDLTFVGTSRYPRSARNGSPEVVRSPGGGAITAVGAARLGVASAIAAPIGDDLAGDLVRKALADEGVESIATRSAPRTPTTVVMPFGGDRAMVTVEPGSTLIGYGCRRERSTSSGSESRPALHRSRGDQGLCDVRRRRCESLCGPTSEGSHGASTPSSPAGAKRSC